LDLPDSEQHVFTFRTGRVEIFAIQKDANSWFKSQTHRRMVMESIGCIQGSLLVREAQGGKAATRAKRGKAYGNHDLGSNLEHCSVRTGTSHSGLDLVVEHNGALDKALLLEWVPATT
jgi:hypothetical protein